jgi:hypothetical protein
MFTHSTTGRQGRRRSTYSWLFYLVVAAALLAWSMVVAFAAAA